MFNAVSQKTCSSGMFKTKCGLLNMEHKHRAKIVQAINSIISKSYIHLEHAQNMFKPDVQAKTLTLEHDSFPLKGEGMFKTGAPYFRGVKKENIPPRFFAAAYEIPRLGRNIEINSALFKFAAFIKSCFTS